MELRGIAASLGVASGPVYVLPSAEHPTRRRISNPDAQIARLRQAIEESHAEIESAKAALSTELGEESALVLDAQLLMHRDQLLVESACRVIVDDNVNAEWALRRTIDKLRVPLLTSGSRYFRERADDIEHVGRHILRKLMSPHSHLALDLPGPRILVARDLSPADAVRLLADPSDRILGLITELGSATSHTSLLARALEVPAVVGVSSVISQIHNDVPTIVDGLRGIVVASPNDKELEAARARGERYGRFVAELAARRDEPTATIDGHSVTFLANIELPIEALAASAHGARGVGLFRTEFLYLGRNTPPTEDEQLAIYQNVLEATEPQRVVVRTFDLGGEKLPKSERLPAAPNPALGLRAFRLAVRRPTLLKAQLRAILRASAQGAIEVMFPMVGSVEELRQAKELVRTCRDELAAEGLPHGELPVGMMIEVPSAALLADHLVKEVDFVSVGTNDLIQYTLAADRSNPEVAHLATPLDPAVLRLLNMTAEAASRAGARISMCGDMAADPFALPLVLGLGFQELSVPVAALPLAAEVVRRLSMEELREAAQEAVLAPSAAAVRRMIRDRFSDALGELWQEQGLSY